VKDFGKKAKKNKKKQKKTSKGIDLNHIQV